MANSAILLFGPPGSGKGTQAVLLSQKLHVPQVSTGDIFRKHVKEKTELGRKVQAIMQSGGLVPDPLVNEIVESRLAEPDCAQGFLLDGYPRTLPQAALLDGLLDRLGQPKVVVNINVDYNIIIDRIVARRQCPQCGASYNLAVNPPKRDSVCDRDGVALVQREDDKEEVVRKRIDAYTQQTLPVMGFFRQNGYRLVDVTGGNGAPEDLTAVIMARLNGA